MSSVDFGTYEERVIASRSLGGGRDNLYLEHYSSILTEHFRLLNLLVKISLPWMKASASIRKKPGSWTCGKHRFGWLSSFSLWSHHPILTTHLEFHQQFMNLQYLLYLEKKEGCQSRKKSFGNVSLAKAMEGNIPFHWFLVCWLLKRFPIFPELFEIRFLSAWGRVRLPLDQVRWESGFNVMTRKSRQILR